MSKDLLFSSYNLGQLPLKNRIVMAPMTRNRALGNLPSEVHAAYYGQRADAGLIVTEGTSPAPEGLGYARIPALFNDAHVAGWKPVTAAVHAHGSHIFVQLMHTGRAGHPANLPAGAELLGPSAVALGDDIWVDPAGGQPAPVPKAMTEADIERTLEAYAHAAELAIAAGFDGVELHGANGYLIDQFLNTASNLRTDRWGGEVQGRIRFAVEVARRTAARIGAQRVGMRISPYGVFNHMSTDPATESVFEALACELATLKLAYLHIVDHSSMGAPAVTPSIKQRVREVFTGTLILSGGYDRDRAEADLAAKRADLIAFGRPFIANPRLVTKLRTGAPLTAPDAATFYTPTAKGYTDYPAEA